MMTSAITRPLTRPLQARMFSAAAAQAESVPSSDTKYNIKKLNNGLVVASVETSSPIARVAVVAKAGSRNEGTDGLGLSHVLRHAAKLKTTNLSQLAITRASQQIGGDITCESTREYVMYKSNVTRNVLPNIMEILKEITTKQSFRRWEVEDLQASDSLKLDLAVLAKQPHIHAVELLHEAAFRDTLGRSLFIPQHNVGKFTNADLQAYCERNFTKGRLALVGVGVDISTLEALGSEFQPYDAQSPQTGAASYHGGEIKHNSGGDLSYVAFAFEGPSVGSKDLLPAEVLKQILGVGPSIKYSGGKSCLAQAAAKASPAPHYVSSLTANYSDSGLFGFSAVAPASDINEIAKAAGQELKKVLSTGVKEADVTKAKNQLKASISMELENHDTLLSWVGEQALSGDQLLRPADVLKMVDAVTVADVNNAAKKIGSSKPSMSASGNTTNIPYIDQLV